MSINSQGWTDIVPSADSRIIYVSNSAGNNANSGLSQASPKKTIAAGMALLRNGYPDWLLLKKGDTWNEPLGSSGWDLSGRSSQEPMVVWSYGSGERPILKTGTGSAIDRSGGITVSHLAFMGVNFYASQRDPASPDYSAASAGQDPSGVYWLAGGNDVLIEDCAFKFYAGNVIQAYSGAISDIRLRRDIIVDDYSVTGSHAQGLYVFGVNTLLIEECVFSHNGWNEQLAGAEATMFNHNIYIDCSSDLTVRKNILLKPSSMQMKFCTYVAGDMVGVVVDNNLTVGGEIGVSLGGNANGVADRFRNISVTNNVFESIGRWNATGRDVGWTVEFSDVNTAEARGNLIFNQTDVSNSFAFDIAQSAKSLTISDNVMYRVTGSFMQLETGAAAQSIVISSNALQVPVGGTTPLYDYYSGFGKMTFAHNTYYTGTPSIFASLNSVNKTYAQWVSASGETGSAVQQISYPDPSRTVESYNALQGNPATFDNFDLQVRAQSRDYWRPEYSASVINNYLRAGFGMASIQSDSTPPSSPQNVAVAIISPTQINLSWDASTDNVGVAGYRVYRGGVSIGTTALTSFSNVGLTPATTYTYMVAAYDAEGNTSVLSSSVTVVTPVPGSDTQPPSIPQNLVATAVSTATITLSWTASTDNVGVAGYHVFRNSVWISSTTQTAFTDMGLAASTAYSYAISAYDAAGNTSALSASAAAVTASMIEAGMPDRGASLLVVGSKEGRGTINPGRDETAKIYFNGTEIGRYECRIYTNLREEVWTSELSNVKSGMFEWTAKNAASGVFIAVVKGPNFNNKRKIVIIR